MSWTKYHIGQVINASPDITPEELKQAKADARKYIESCLQKGEPPPPHITVASFLPLSAPFSITSDLSLFLKEVTFEVIAEFIE